MRNFKSLALSFFLLACSLANGQGMLTKADVSRFIDTYEPMAKELEELGDDWEGVNMNTMNAFSANAQVMGILEKYGWDEGLITKWSMIAMGYSLVKMDEQLAALPEAQREQYKTALAAQQMSFTITDEDKDLIKARMSDLDRLFDQ